jgi:hypothetical protein
VHVDPLLVVRHEDDLADAVDALVMLELLSAIVFGGARARDLDEDGGVHDRIGIVLIAFHVPTDDAHIRVRIQARRRNTDADIRRLHATPATP